MLENCKISGFADEISEQVEEQIRVLNNLGQTYVEFRRGDGKNISDYTLEEAKALKKRLDDAGIQVSSIGSPIGKIKITEDFDEHYSKYKHVVEIAKILDTKYIRMFSFYLELGEESAYKDEVFRRLEMFIEYAKKENVILLHENEKGIYGDIGSRCKELMDRLYCEHFKMLFDFANFVQCDEDTVQVYELLKKYIHYIHIKDALQSTHQVVPAGLGDGNLKEILKDLNNNNYNGFLSLEPHLSNFSGFEALEKLNSKYNNHEKFIDFIHTNRSLKEGTDKDKIRIPYEIAYFALKGLLEEIV